MNLKKIVTIGLAITSLFCITGCSNEQHTTKEVMEVISSTSKITKYKENILLNYAVDDNAITASGEIKHDIKNKISSGNIKVNFNENIFDITLFEKDGKTYFLDKNNKYYYTNISLQEISSGLNKNVQEETINFIKIKQDQDQNLDSYRLDLKLNKSFNTQLSEIGKIFFNKEEIKDIDKISIQKSLSFEDGYSYKTEINLAQILESNLVNDTSVIGVANIILEIEDSKEEVILDEDKLNKAEELINFDSILKTFIEEETE